MIQSGDVADWRKAGKIAAQALSYGRSLVVPGAKARDVLDAIEDRIRELGGEIAFPAQLSTNEIAAHWCAAPDDGFTFTDEVVCLDVGVHVNGCIGDNACTIDLSGSHQPLVEASRAALEKAVSVIRPGITLGEIGTAIQETIESYGYSPVRNLSGHGLDVYDVHAYPSVPNIATADTTELPAGKIIAIEPFATDGAGAIQESTHPTVFMMVARKPVRSPYARQLLKVIESFNGLPFTTRWLTKAMPKGKVLLGLRELVRAGAVKEFPPLVEVKKGLVSQAEYTVLVGDTPEILTRIE